MLSVFPYLLSWQQLSPFLIRLTLGFIFMFWSYKALTGRSESSTNKIVSIIEIVAGLLVVIGLWTQVAALVILVDLLIRLGKKIADRTFLTDGVNYYLILLVLAISTFCVTNRILHLQQ